jgi:hypothetical protein
MASMTSWCWFLTLPLETDSASVLSAASALKGRRASVGHNTMSKIIRGRKKSECRPQRDERRPPRVSGERKRERDIYSKREKRDETTKRIRTNVTISTRSDAHIKNNKSRWRSDGCGKKNDIACLRARCSSLPLGGIYLCTVTRKSSKAALKRPQIKNLHKQKLIQMIPLCLL